MLAGLDRQKANKRNLHAGKRSQCIPCRVTDIEPCAVTAHADQNKGMQRKDTCDEGISTPGGHHVSIEQCAQSAPKHGAKLQSLDPEEEGEDQEENCDGLVIIAACNGSRDVAGGNAHESSGKKTS